MSDQTSIRRCRICACYQPHTVQLGVGFCFCMPPSAVPVRQPDGSMGIVAAFPPVTGDNFCFQWRPRLEAANDAASDVASVPAEEPPHGP